MQAKNLRCGCAFAGIARACILLVSERYALQSGMGVCVKAQPGLHPGYEVGRSEVWRRIPWAPHGGDHAALRGLHPLHDATVASPS